MGISPKLECRLDDTKKNQGLLGERTTQYRRRKLEDLRTQDKLQQRTGEHHRLNTVRCGKIIDNIRDITNTYQSVDERI